VLLDDGAGVVRGDDADAVVVVEDVAPVVREVLPRQAPQGEVTHGEDEVVALGHLARPLVVGEVLALEDAGFVARVACVIQRAILLLVEEVVGIAVGGKVGEDCMDFVGAEVGIARGHLEEGGGVPGEGLALLEILDAGIVEEDKHGISGD